MRPQQHGHTFKITLGEVPEDAGIGKGKIGVFMQFWGDPGRHADVFRKRRWWPDSFEMISWFARRLSEPRPFKTAAIQL